MVNRRERRHKRIRKKVFGTDKRPRLSIYRSLRYIYAQLIDDINSSTILTFSTQMLKDEKLSTMNAARECGKRLAEKAKGKGIETVVFDRSGYKYHGRIKALAEGAKEGGLNF
ncbi:50S ribosomal protein L18 [candidate division WOR-3 bacterium]|nr:50S ribosomal protein L18 [candidate division WOR-3 bacterium]